MNVLILIMDVITVIFPVKIATKIVRSLAVVVLKLKPRYTQSLINSVKAVFPLISAEESKRIVFESQKNHFSFFVTYKFLAISPLKKIKSMLAQVDIIGKEHVDALYKINRPIVIVSIHMGDFFKGFLKLTTLASDKQDIGIIKWMPPTYKEKKAYRKFVDLGAPLKIFRLRNKPGLETIRFLRNNNILITLCDIRSTLIKTGEVTFLNKKAHLPLGPAELAIASQAFILPVYVRTENHREILTISSPIDTTQLDSSLKTLQEKGKKITQELAYVLESWIRQHPEQWHFWGVLEALWEN